MTEQVNFTLGIIGTLASLVGAWLSIKYAKQARTAAEIAERTKQELFDKQVNSELHTILIESKRVQHGFGKYRLPSQNRTLDGINHEKDIEDYQKLLSIINENKSKLTKINGFNFNTYYSKSKRTLNEFSISTNNEEIQKKGIEVISDLDIIVSVLRKEIDEFSKK
jgi:hypothetical protein